MIDCAPKWRLFLFLILSFVTAGCSQLKRGSLEEEKEPHFLEGKKRASRLDWEGSIQSYERALQANPNNASAHLELGVLYDTKKNDPTSAIYHYQKHLTLRTNSPMADVVKDKIIGCTRELAKTVPFGMINREVQRDLERLAQTNSILKARVESLEGELARRPQYVTNYITNFVGVPQMPASSTRLTQPTQPIIPDPDETVERPASPSNPRATEKTQVAAKNSPKPASTAIRRDPPAAERRRPEPVPPPSTGTRSVHTVRPGETLATLASRYGVSLQALKAANPGAARGVRSGQKINVPK